MKSKRTRRDFMAKSVVALGAVAAGGMAGISALASPGPKEETMPHISVKLFPGRSEETRQRLADAIVSDVVNIIGVGEESVSVSIEEVPPGEWKEEVYDPEIRDNLEFLYRKPGYSM